VCEAGSGLAGTGNSNPEGLRGALTTKTGPMQGGLHRTE
jgi:hypothetical protein